ncbi:MAG: 16S rRNA (cytosine(1402)-N(4))-methyltransferase RsmH [Thermoanaerobaculia bacterium]
MAHVPVLVREVIGYLAPLRDGLVADCTLGAGGHAAALLEAVPGLRIVGIDRDPQARQLAAGRLGEFGDRVRILGGEFAELGSLLRHAGIGKVDGILADLGVSSMQLENPERGFSFRREGPLDMRMGPGELTAREIVNRYSEAELQEIFREHGEERRARRIAQAVIEARSREPIETTAELRRIVHKAVARGPRQRIDPATRVFQALRIEVNQELEGLSRLLDQVVELLDTDGRLVVISYHSLEDRMVKHRLRDLARGEIDEATGRRRSESRLIEVLTKKPVRPTPAEVAANPRARSARLRAFRRL